MQEESNREEFYAAQPPPAEANLEKPFEPSPNDPPWSSPIAVLVWLASIVFIFVLQALFVGGYAASNGVNFSDSGSLAEFLKTDAGASISAIISVIPAHLLTLLLVWVIVTNFNKYSFTKTLGWRFDKFKIWYVFGITGVILAIAGSLTAYFGATENELMRLLNSSRYAVYIVAFLATFTAPLVEELVYRGVLYSAFQRTFSPTAAVILVTFLFALVHVPQYLPDYIAISVICLLSLILTLIRAYTNNILPCIALHFVFNGVQSLFLLFSPFFEKYAQNPEAKTASVVRMFFQF